MTLGELALDGFPATLLPNPLVRELATLAREANADLPRVEELAADIFMGRFSVRFLRDAHLAGELLAGSLYARHYDIDYPALPPMDTAQTRRPSAGMAALDALCRARADVPDGGSRVAANGIVIEQAQVLTNHNLPQPGDPDPRCGRRPRRHGWAAWRTVAVVLRLVGRLDGNSSPLGDDQGRGARLAASALPSVPARHGTEAAHPVLPCRARRRAGRCPYPVRHRRSSDSATSPPVAGSSATARRPEAAACRAGPLATTDWTSRRQSHPQQRGRHVAMPLWPLYCSTGVMGIR